MTLNQHHHRKPVVGKSNYVVILAPSLVLVSWYHIYALLTLLSIKMHSILCFHQWLNLWPG